MCSYRSSQQAVLLGQISECPGQGNSCARSAIILHERRTYRRRSVLKRLGLHYGASNASWDWFRVCPISKLYRPVVVMWPSDLEGEVPFLVRSASDCCAGRRSRVNPVKQAAIRHMGYYRCV
ncbi:hypothetical protein NDU88_005007 [Pleurodeles waltl]|uniref:Uncharacterized protein n=1 Tax=Pleurodeles waltl TaxID=8319 RepID=A0AAV7M9Z4_PLEWA|nr:hypothetical protein NDU88_005007 [Pleurodeles waltl]